MKALVAIQKNETFDTFFTKDNIAFAESLGTIVWHNTANESLDELRKRHKHVESCQDSLPKALVSFFEGNSYEDVIRNAISLGGDTDTLAAIAGAMAEGMYEIP